VTLAAHLAHPHMWHRQKVLAESLLKLLTQAILLDRVVAMSMNLHWQHPRRHRQKALVGGYLHDHKDFVAVEGHRRGLLAESHLFEERTAACAGAVDAACLQSAEQ